MLKKTSTAHRTLKRLNRTKASVLRRFGRDEEGSIIVLTLMLLIMMLVLGGMAVDFMRFESRRAALQSVADRAVLAAANLDQDLEPEALLDDYFEKAGFEGAIQGTPEIVDEPGSRSIGVQSELDINTFYLRFVGINQLSAPAASTALEGTGNVEVSLVLDISGSMNSSVSGTGNTRMGLIREAASGFVDDLLVADGSVPTDPDYPVLKYEDQVSINLITYSAQVNIGPEIFNQLNINRLDATSPLITTGPDDNDKEIHIDDPRLDPDSDEYNPLLNVVDEFGNDILDWDSTSYTGPERFVTFTVPSTCIDIPISEYTKAAFDTDLYYDQVEMFQHRKYHQGQSDADTDNPHLDQPNCPRHSYEEIIAHSQDPVELKAAIGQLHPRQFTAIYLGMKWGLTMLDPSMRDIVENISGVDDSFAGVRPTDWGSDASGVNTQKYIILMTDGKNVAGRRIKDEDYDDVAEQLRWYESNFPYTDRAGYWGDWGNMNSDNITNENWSETDGNTRLQESCKAARELGITIFAIAMAAPSEGETQMRNCATPTEGTSETAGYYFENDGGEIDTIFENIAKQITALRLTL